jgi:hypothetical protein
MLQGILGILLMLFMVACADEEEKKIDPKKNLKNKTTLNSEINNKDNSITNTISSDNGTANITNNNNNNIDNSASTEEEDLDNGEDNDDDPDVETDINNPVTVTSNTTNPSNTKNTVNNNTTNPNNANNTANNSTKNPNNTKNTVNNNTTNPNNTNNTVNNNTTNPNNTNNTVNNNTTNPNNTTNTNVNNPPPPPPQKKTGNFFTNSAPVKFVANKLSKIPNPITSFKNWWNNKPANGGNTNNPPNNNQPPQNNGPVNNTNPLTIINNTVLTVIEKKPFEDELVKINTATMFSTALPAFATFITNTANGAHLKSFTTNSGDNNLLVAFLKNLKAANLPSKQVTDFESTVPNTGLRGKAVHAVIKAMKDKAFTGDEAGWTAFATTNPAGAKDFIMNSLDSQVAEAVAKKFLLIQ